MFRSYGRYETARRQLTLSKKCSVYCAHLIYEDSSACVIILVRVVDDYSFDGSGWFKISLFEDNYSVSVNSHIPLIDTKAARSINPLERIHAITTRNWQASNEPCVIIQMCPSGLLFTKTRLQLTCWHFTAKEEDTGLEKSKCWNRVDRLSRCTGSERKHQKHIQKKHIQKKTHTKKTHTKITYNHARHEIPRLSDNENNKSTSHATSLGWRIRNEAFRIRENVEKGPQILKQRKRYRLTFQLAVSHNAALRKLTTASKLLC